MKKKQRPWIFKPQQLSVFPDLIFLENTSAALKRAKNRNKPPMIISHKKSAKV